MWVKINIVYKMFKMWPFLTSQWGMPSCTRSSDNRLHLHTDIKRLANFHEICCISFWVISFTRKVNRWQMTDNKLPRHKLEFFKFCQKPMLAIPMGYEYKVNVTTQQVLSEFRPTAYLPYRKSKFFQRRMDQAPR